MLDEYRIEPLSVGQYLDRVDNEDIKIDQAVQRSFCWNKEMMNALIYSALSRKIYIPNFILAEEKRNDGTKQTYVVDGGQRTETLYQFKYGDYIITNNLRSYIIPYKKRKVDEKGNVVRDEYGNIQYELVEYDIRKKTYNELPEELKKKFDGCPLTTVIYQDCTTEETSELVLLYNNHVGMNVSQKSLTYIGKFADEIKRIKDNNRFLMDCTSLSENEKKNGVWEKDVEEMNGHFLMFNRMLDTLTEPLTQALIKQFHYELKSGVFEDRANGYAIGDYKKRPNMIGMYRTVSPEEVAQEMDVLLEWYHNQEMNLSVLAEFHARYESIHPFQDGNGRTGRMLLFRECLKNGILPVVIEDANRNEYLDALKVYREEKSSDKLVELFEKEQQFYLAKCKYFM